MQQELMLCQKYIIKLHDDQEKNERKWNSKLIHIALCLYVFLPPK